ncbi:carboxymuconolactone decarboxylase family protein [Microbispora sp. RL4-1S]|uniref:Carboxymuconolactone decarboxylase family protein n=1 Tax=Microbispora oryzae TaxID=2806554 RepID=A0A940WFD1_9ACTN|nr:carboxymuconolactone decarboxylase family protein [Microbispora oryzae]MBP2704510.1 carboxymuconolactone decarboxylase family protein [Microbispora oryzae]
MEARMKNPAHVLPESLKGIQAMMKGVYSGGAPQEVLELTALRASQINGCSACVHSHVRNLKKAGESDERVGNVAAWQEAPFYTDAERAALALAEAMTRNMADRSGDAVPDELWEAVAGHYDERQLSAVILNIAVTNMFNRLNATIKEPAGQTWD